MDNRRDSNYDFGALPRAYVSEDSTRSLFAAWIVRSLVAFHSVRDVQSVYNAQVQQHLLESLTALLGIPNAPVYPPRPSYAGQTIDVRSRQPVLAVESSNSRESISQSKLAITNPGSEALLPPAIITFSRPPPQIPNPPVGIFNGGSFAAIAQRNLIPPVTVDLATRVFQANSIVVSHHPLAQLQVWQKVLGLEPGPASKGSIPAASIKPATAASAVNEGRGGSISSRVTPKKASNIVLVTAPPSEIEYHDQPRPKDLSVLALAYEMFVMPAAQQQTGRGPNNVVSSHILDSVSALGLSSSSVSTSSSHPNSFSGVDISLSNHFPALSLGSSSASTSSSRPPSSPALGVPRVASPSSSISPSPVILPLITPQVVLWNLPTQPWSKAFLHEFDTLMITHDGIGASGMHSILKKRIERMIEWADDSMKKLGSTDGEPGSDSGSKCSFASSPPPVPDQWSNSIPQRRGGGGITQQETKPLPPPPTLSLFAVTCAVYALGALSYGSKSIHGRFFEDSGGALELANTTPCTPLNPHMHPLLDKATPGNLFKLARAALLVHDEYALPHSLDYLHAHMLTWLYLLHPSDSASSVTSRGFQGSSTGVGSGGMTVIEQTIYKELGKCVSVARAMGLDLVDQRRVKPLGGAFGFGRVKEKEEKEEEMGTWEREMRRRLWWQLMMFDHQISENFGRPPLIPLGTYACKAPSEADESLFGPTAMAIPKPRKSAKGHNTTYFATKCQLLAVIKTLPYTQCEEGVTLDLATKLDDQVSSWRSSLPAQYEIEFQPGEPEDTLFPELDIVDVQACDLHIMANAFLLRLWLPLFNDALADSSQSSQSILFTATTAAHEVIVASHHLITRFRAARPMSFGHYEFGNSLWLAMGILASVVTMRSDVIYLSTAIRGVEIAGSLFRDQVVEGKSDLNHVPKYEVNNIICQIEQIVAQARKSKRPSESNHRSAADLGETQDSVPIPYVGTAAMTTATATQETWRNVPGQYSDGTSSDSTVRTPLPS
ncbi:hypothetical protein FS837_004129 [Tulasnella sp. UAMH 9824]|nr:hypothetical protein FS837_004129 [Tulasnella sp. UAMH 9824]